MFKTYFKSRNKERTLAHGLRIGDIVEPPRYADMKEAEVIAYGTLTDSCVYVRDPNGSGMEIAAEECKLITKVEDRSFLGGAG